MCVAAGGLADFESVLLVGRLADAEPRLCAVPIDASPNPECIAEVGMVTFVERPQQPEARLNGCDVASPVDLHATRRPMRPNGLAHQPPGPLPGTD
jgi:hypothetical protein